MFLNEVYCTYYLNRQAQLLRLSNSNYSSPLAAYSRELVIVLRHRVDQVLRKIAIFFRWGMEWTKDQELMLKSSLLYGRG